jgi:hypothetical protein
MTKAAAAIAPQRAPMYLQPALDAINWAHKILGVKGRMEKTKIVAYFPRSFAGDCSAITAKAINSQMPEPLPLMAIPAMKTGIRRAVLQTIMPITTSRDPSKATYRRPIKSATDPKKGHTDAMANRLAITYQLHMSTPPISLYTYGLEDPYMYMGIYHASACYQEESRENPYLTRDPQETQADQRRCSVLAECPRWTSEGHFPGRARLSPDIFAGHGEVTIHGIQFGCHLAIRGREKLSLVDSDTERGDDWKSRGETEEREARKSPCAGSRMG